VGPEDAFNAGVFVSMARAVADARDATLACVVAKEDVAQADYLYRYSSWLRGMRRLTEGQRIRCGNVCGRFVQVATHASSDKQMRMRATTTMEAISPSICSTWTEHVHRARTLVNGRMCRYSHGRCIWHHRQRMCLRVRTGSGGCSCHRCTAAQEGSYLALRMRCYDVMLACNLACLGLPGVMRR
jgi:hypothetical protein